MTISLTQKDNLELWVEAAKNRVPKRAREPFESLFEMPKIRGKGYARSIEVHPKLVISISDYENHEDALVKIPTWDHPVQFGVLLSGTVGDSQGQYFGERYMLISGSGVQRGWTAEYRRGERILGVNIEMPPEMLATFFFGEDGHIPSELGFLAKGNDWQTLLYLETNLATQTVARQIIHCPYKGIMKRIYLQTKALEMITLQLTPILADQGSLQSSSRLKTSSITRIHYAREILQSRLENPPSLPELGQMVGASDRTLQRGFRQLFGMTVFGYLTDKRMERAEQIFRQGDVTVAEVANQVGYSHLGHFAIAFKRKFGITPSECLAGQKSLSGL
ncbi:MAG: AraC family transcriptional regulator [Brasilonema angustatum HA4187-MV1]|jgi:AraC-like DNA-binding protein|nr:AraC family transcriptional regulator [Brasilonema angustatum HA4187-MV1]